MRVIACGLDRLDAAVDDGLYVAGVVGFLERRQKSEIHTKGLVGHLAAATDFIGQVLRRALCQSGDDAQAARVGNSCSQFGKAYIVHTALNNGVADTEHVCDESFHWGK